MSLIKFISLAKSLVNITISCTVSTFKKEVINFEKSLIYNLSYKIKRRNNGSSRRTQKHPHQINYDPPIKKSNEVTHLSVVGFSKKHKLVKLFQGEC